jgi:hypothetical protein
VGSDLTQRVAINEIAESIMAFNTNYKDTGLFGVYAVAKVNPELHSYLSFISFLYLSILAVSSHECLVLYLF